MEKFTNPKKEKDSIYEIYRACRLCGGGSGYKMPIILNIANFDVTGVELKQKIRECVQIEVNQDDKMPPLICELCVDKVNDFYEFLEMCRQVNRQTRNRLGLPIQSFSRGVSDAGDCILGLTEPLFVNDDYNGEPPPRPKRPAPKIKINIRNEPFTTSKKKKKTNKGSPTQSKKSEVPPRVTRKSQKEDDEPLSNLKEGRMDEDEDMISPRVTRNRSKDDDKPLTSLLDTSKPSKGVPKSILKRRLSLKDEEAVNVKTLKRAITDEPKAGPASKKVKISVVPISTLKKSSPSSSTSEEVKRQRTLDTASSKKQAPARKREPSESKSYVCDVCGQCSKTVQARSSHLKTHAVSFTNPKLACNPCEDWFPTREESSAHHDNHTKNGVPYYCRSCYSNFKTLFDFDLHLKNKECIPTYEAPDVKCDVCWHMFPTYNILYSHDCPGEDERPGGSCAKCNRNFSLHKNLVKHENTCKANKQGEPVVDEKILNQLKALQVRIARCDPLLVKNEWNRYDVSSVSSDHGLDRNCYYPFMSKLRLQSGSSAMVDIHVGRFFDSMDTDDVDTVKIDPVTNSIGDQSDMEDIVVGNNSADVEVKNESASCSGVKSDHIPGEVNNTSNHNNSIEVDDVEASIRDTNNAVKSLLAYEKSQNDMLQNASSFTNGQSDNCDVVQDMEVNDTDGKELSNNTPNICEASVSCNIMNNSNDEIDLQTNVKTVECKTDLGINNFSFDTI